MTAIVHTAEVAAWQRSRGAQEEATKTGQMGLFGVNKTDGHGV